LTRCTSIKYIYPCRAGKGYISICPHTPPVTPQPKWGDWSTLIKRGKKNMAIKEPNSENWLTPENMKKYIEYLDELDEMIEAQIEAHIEAKHNGD
jgi:hypothetical protein